VVVIVVVAHLNQCKPAGHRRDYRAFVQVDHPHRSARPARNRLFDDC
jgi:hypothetical protein